MIIHTASWPLERAVLSCGHHLSVRAGEQHAWCSWCSRTMAVRPQETLPVAA